MAVHALWNGGMECINSIPGAGVSVLAGEPVELGATSFQRKGLLSTEDFRDIAQRVIRSRVMA